ncbi:MAG TPA: polyprenyl synthetase family protein [Candidatus Paceibacterota bacterium]
MMTLAEFKSWFDPHLFSILEEKITRFNAYSTVLSVHEVACYARALATEGKRIRPYLAYVGYCTAHTEASAESIRHFLVGIELFHLFALVHDDIMDRAETRHGVRAVHTLFGGKYGDGHVGVSLGILLGDVFLAWSYECIHYACALHDTRGERARDEFSILASEVVHGQMIDVLCTTKKNAHHEFILEKMRLKSAQYSFFRPLHMGLLLAGATKRDETFAKEYAQNLGLAFQIQDDLLDLEHSTGKAAFTDIREGQHTLLSWYMHECAEDPDQELFLRYFGVSFPESEDDTVAALLHQSGAVSYAKTIANEYFEKAYTAIVTHDKANNPVWRDIIETVKKRKK